MIFAEKIRSFLDPPPASDVALDRSVQAALCARRFHRTDGVSVVLALAFHACIIPVEFAIAPPAMIPRLLGFHLVVVLLVVIRLVVTRRFNAPFPWPTTILVTGQVLFYIDVIRQDFDLVGTFLAQGAVAISVISCTFAFFCFPSVACLGMAALFMVAFAVYSFAGIPDAVPWLILYGVGVPIACVMARLSFVLGLRATRSTFSRLSRVAPRAVVMQSLLEDRPIDSIFAPRDRNCI